MSGLLAMTVATMLAVVPVGQTAEGGSTESTAERAAAAAERAAVAAEQAAKAVEKIAAELERRGGAVPVDAATPVATPAVAPAVIQPEWTGSIGASLISLQGNAESLTTSGIATVQRKTENWVISGKLVGSYGQSRPSGETESQVVALNGLAQGRVDRRFTPTVSSYGVLGLETDHLKSIEYRALGEVGAGIVWVERAEKDFQALMLRTDLAVRYAQESRFQYYPTRQDVEDITLIAPKLGVSFRYGLSKDISFVEEAEVLLNIAGDFRVLVSSTSKLTTRLIENVSLGVGFQITHDSLPAAGKVPTDSALTVGVEVGF